MSSAGALSSTSATHCSKQPDTTLMLYDDFCVAQAAYGGMETISTEDADLLTTSSILTDHQIWPTLHLRFLTPTDIDQVKDICKEIFPIEYPDYWFEDITSNPNLFSVAAAYEEKIIGVIVAEVKRLNQCNVEDRDLLSKSFPANTPVAYVLSLGVLKQHRRQGVASILLDHLLSYLTNGIGTPLGLVKAVYLHVLATNQEAISFYERRKFRRHHCLTGYYAISNEMRDGYSYVLYMNGGHAPWSFSYPFKTRIFYIYFCIFILQWLGTCLHPSSLKDVASNEFREDCGAMVKRVLLWPCLLPKALFLFCRRLGPQILWYPVRQGIMDACHFMLD